MTEQFDVVSRPKHYNTHPSGVECIEITRHMGFNLGNAFKYLYRYGEKGNAIVDLGKALQYIEFEEQTRAHFLFAPKRERSSALWKHVRGLVEEWANHTASQYIREAGVWIVLYDLAPEPIEHNFNSMRKRIHLRINELKEQSNDNS